MTKLWHPHIKDLSIERDEADIAAYVAAGWLKAKSRRASIEVEAGESLAEAVEEARDEKPKAAKAAKASEPAKANETTSTGDGEDN